MPDASQPQMKAGHIKQNLVLGEELAGARVEDFRRVLGAKAIEEIESVSKVAWLPVALDIHLNHAIEEICGPGSNRARSRASTHESLSGGLLGPLVEGVRRVFGLNPSSVMKVLPRGWGALYRNCGVAKVVKLDDKRAAVDFRELPPLVVNDAIYLDSVAGGFHALLDICAVEGDVTVEDPNSDAGTVRFLFVWG